MSSSSAFPETSVPPKLYSQEADEVIARDPASVDTRIKRAMDFSIGILSIMFLLPLLVTIMSILFVAQGRPIFVKHRRVGRGGTDFYCLKFRTMVRNAGEALETLLASDAKARAEWEATRKLRKDPRVTALGYALRKASVDELPQLFNIIRGEMSLVGPRPIVQDEIGYYGGDIMHYYKVRPGLTGPWQVSGRSDTSYAKRVQMDVEYVKRWSLAQDIFIMLKTVPAVFSSRGSY